MLDWAIVGDKKTEFENKVIILRNNVKMLRE